MRILLLIVLCMCWLILCGCAKAHTPVVRIDPAFQPFVDQWHQDAIATTGKDVPINDLIFEFADDDIQLTGDENGYCLESRDASPIIRIDRTFWNENQYIPGGYDVNSLLVAVLYHELGHCVLNRGHDNDTETIAVLGASAPGTTASAYESIMNYESLVPSWQWASYKQEMLKEYFSREHQN